MWRPLWSDWRPSTSGSSATAPTDSPASTWPIPATRWTGGSTRRHRPPTCCGPDAGWAPTGTGWCWPTPSRRPTRWTARYTTGCWPPAWLPPKRSVCAAKTSRRSCSTSFTARRTARRLPPTSPWCFPMPGWRQKSRWPSPGEDVVVVLRPGQHAGQALAVEWPQIDVVIVGEVPRVATGVPHGWAHRLGDVVGEAAGGLLGDFDGGDLARAESPQPFGDIAGGQVGNVLQRHRSGGRVGPENREQVGESGDGGHSPGARTFCPGVIDRQPVAAT